jgi:hypothetical protein
LHEINPNQQRVNQPIFMVNVTTKIVSWEIQA